MPICNCITAQSRFAIRNAVLERAFGGEMGDPSGVGFPGRTLELGTRGCWVANACISFRLQLVLSLLKRVYTPKKFQPFSIVSVLILLRLGRRKQRFFWQITWRAVRRWYKDRKNKGRTQSKQTTSAFQGQKYSLMQLPTDFLQYCYKKSRQ